MTPVPRSLAVLATVPGREAALERCLEALRPQVEKIHVVCHELWRPPVVVLRFANSYTCEPDTQGSAAKLRLAEVHQGLYLACDDDMLYPPDYAETMLRWVRRWKGRALVCCHGRVLRERAVHFLDAEAAATLRGENTGFWLNYPGAAGMAWDTRLGLPAAVPGKNLEEPHLAVWCQRHQVPIWLVPHKADWLPWLLPEHAPGVPTIWDQEKAANFEKRNAVLAEYVQGGGTWKLYKPSRRAKSARRA